MGQTRNRVGRCQDVGNLRVLIKKKSVKYIYRLVFTFSRSDFRTRVRRSADRVQISCVQAQPEQHGKKIRTTGIRGRH